MCRGNTSIATFSCEINKLVEMRVEVFSCFFLSKHFVGILRKHFAGILRIETSPTILTFLRLRFAISTALISETTRTPYEVINEVA